jgi:hypothetical protein
MLQELSYKGLVTDIAGTRPSLFLVLRCGFYNRCACFSSFARRVLQILAATALSILYGKSIKNRESTESLKPNNDPKSAHEVR